MGDGALKKGEGTGGPQVDFRARERGMSEIDRAR
ncbi:MAG: hypothetical protein RLZZ244_2103 [Verrucomicrobiota bacterium]